MLGSSHQGELSTLVGIDRFEGLGQTAESFDQEGPELLDLLAGQLAKASGLGRWRRVGRKDAKLSRKMQRST